MLVEVLNEAEELGNIRQVGLDLSKGVREVGAEGVGECYLLGGALR